MLKQATIAFVPMVPLHTPCGDASPAQTANGTNWSSMNSRRRNMMTSNVKKSPDKGKRSLPKVRWIMMLEAMPRGCSQHPICVYILEFGC